MGSLWVQARGRKWVLVSDTPSERWLLFNISCRRSHRDPANSGLRIDLRFENTSTRGGAPSACGYLAVYLAMRLSIWLCGYAAVLRCD
jgi:hypothetical protein